MEQQKSNLDFVRQVQRERRLVSKHQKALLELLAQCPHVEVEHVEKYYDGSYLDRAYTEHSTKCKFCGKVLDTKTEHHDWFG